MSGRNEDGIWGPQDGKSTRCAVRNETVQSISNRKDKVRNLEEGKINNIIKHND